MACRIFWSWPTEYVSCFSIEILAPQVGKISELTAKALLF